MRKIARIAVLAVATTGAVSLVASPATAMQAALLDTSTGGSGS